VTHPNSVVLASVRTAIAHALEARAGSFAADTAITDALEAGTPSQRKALLQELVSEIRVEGRGSVLPTYRLPAGPVRVMSGMVDRRLHKSHRNTDLAGPTISI
jgi:hypothetical protein